MDICVLVIRFVNTCGILMPFSEYDYFLASRSPIQPHTDKAAMRMDGCRYSALWLGSAATNT
jgi:hypothetical protein